MSSAITRQLKVIFLFIKLGVITIFGIVTRGKGRCKCKTRLDGKVALVTGGNTGIGLETARDLAERGATVVIASRNVEKSKAAVKNIVETTGNQNVHFKTLNLLKFSSINKFVKEFNKTYDRLDILVNNSGCIISKQSFSDDGIEKVMQVNYVGPFFMTNLLIDKLIVSKPSRIVIVSSQAHEFHEIDSEDIAGVRLLGSWSRYSNSKLLNILWAKALAKRLPVGVTANTVHPGIVKTEIFNGMSTWLRNVILFVISLIFKNSAEGAQTVIHLCVAPKLKGVSGKYFEECRISAANKVTRDEKLVDDVWKNTMKLINERMPKPL